MILRKKKVEKKSEQERLEEKREQVLAKGKRFKYPMQFSRHRTMIVTIFLAIFAMAMLVGVLFVGLYQSNNTGDMMFRLTKVLPLSVAEIDGQKVRYSDYLLIYRSSIAPIEQQTGNLGATGDADAMRAYYKRSALVAAEDLSYALKIAREEGIEVREEQVAAAVKEQRNVGGTERSEASFLKVLKDNFGLTKSEYERLVYLNLVKTEVAKRIDEEAKRVSDEIGAAVAADRDVFGKMLEKYGEKLTYEENGGLVDVANVDGGRAAVAAKLEVGQVSERFVSSNGDGYYFVKTLEKTDKKVSYASIRVSFKEFDKRVAKIRQEGRVKEYIKL